MNHAIRTIRYGKRIQDYSAYSRAAGRTKKNNWQSVIARKIIIQSLICLLIIFSVSWLQGQTGELAADIISKIKLMVVERNITPQDIYESVAETYKECMQYIKGGN